MHGKAAALSGLHGRKGQQIDVALLRVEDDKGEILPFLRHEAVNPAGTAVLHQDIHGQTGRADLRRRVAVNLKLHLHHRLVRVGDLRLQALAQHHRIDFLLRQLEGRRGLLLGGCCFLGGRLVVGILPIDGRLVRVTLRIGGHLIRCTLRIGGRLVRGTLRDSGVLVRGTLCNSGRLVRGTLRIGGRLVRGTLCNSGRLVRGTLRDSGRLVRGTLCIGGRLVGCGFRIPGRLRLRIRSFI